MKCGILDTGTKLGERKRWLGNFGPKTLCSRMGGQPRCGVTAESRRIENRMLRKVQLGAFTGVQGDVLGVLSNDQDDVAHQPALQLK